MIIGQALAAWFADEERQAATFDRLEEVRRRLRSLPPVAGAGSGARTRRTAATRSRCSRRPGLFLRSEDAIESVST